MALNLSRNTRMWITTNVNATTGVLGDTATGFTAANTMELQILDGYSFSQATNNQVITLNEAGTAPVRGQRSFNTALNPAEFSFSTYIRPSGSAAGTITCAERFLWNALAGDKGIEATPQTVTSGSVMARTVTTTGVVTGAVIAGVSTGIKVGDSLWLSGMGDAAWNSVNAGPLTVTSITEVTNTTIGGTFVKAPTSTGLNSTAGGSTRIARGQWFENATQAYAMTSLAGSNKHQLQKFALIFLVDNVYYAIDNCALNQATIDFGLDAIAMIAWSGNGTAIKKLANITASGTTLGGAVVSAFNANANYITNKLSTVTLKGNIGGTGTNYIIPITGGSFTINNNINYITPSNLGVVNQPIGYYTGTRAVSGTLTAYLRAGAGDTTESGGLLTALLTAGSETKFAMQVEIGGTTNSVKVELDMPGVTLTVPTVDIADVVSTTINFTAQGYDTVLGNQTFDLTATNDLLVRYYSA